MFEHGLSPRSSNDSRSRGVTAIAKSCAAAGLELESDDEFDEYLDLSSLEGSSVDQILREDDEDSGSLQESDPDSARFPMSDERLGRYRILSSLGEGQYARVYRGYDHVLERAVALKVLRPGLLLSAKMRERFLGEARALARLRHPRIVPIFEVGLDADRYYIAMALIEGQSLAELRVRQPESIGFGQAAKFVADLAEALAYAHRQGIVHRDVKPANIQIDQSGDAYLMDFGIAYRPDSGEFPASQATRTGTPAYVAPEQARGDQPLFLQASDQYSLGVVLYELLCGRTPFTGPPLYALFQAMNQEPPSLASIEPTIPTGLAAICMRTLAKCPQNRYPSCDDLADQLRRLIWAGLD